MSIVTSNEDIGELKVVSPSVFVKVTLYVVSPSVFVKVTLYVVSPSVSVGVSELSTGCLISRCAYFLPPRKCQTKLDLGLLNIN